MQANLYVDNIITSCDTEQEAVKYYSKVVQHKFNSRLLLFRRTHLIIVSRYSLRWNPEEYRISLAEKPSILTNEHLITKKKVLQDLSRMFDPLGLTAPILI